MKQAFGPVAVDADPAVVQATVTASRDFGYTPWNRNILGHFIEHFHTQIYGGIYDPGSVLADERGFRQDVIVALKELHVPVVRWPGGNFVSDYHWYQAVGPEREPSYNKAWRVDEPNLFGTDEFIAWSKAVGCEPYICTNGGNGTGEEMSDWVEYCNGQHDTRFARMRRENGSPAPYAVRFWGIGNESYGDWQIGAKTVDEWGRYVAESAKMMRAVDEDIVLSGAAVPDTEWTLRLLQAAGRYLDLVSIHGYWDLIHQVDAPSDYLTCMMRAESPGELIGQTRNVIGAAGLTGKVNIAFDEWNLRGWHHPDGTRQEVIDARDRNDIPSTYTMADAVFSAGFLNACLRNADIVRMANMAPVVNTRGPLFVHRQGIVKRTTFHVLRMYGDLLRANIVASTVKASPLAHNGECVAAIDAIVTGDNQGTTIVLVNRHPTEVARCTVTIGGETFDGDVHAEILDGPSADSYNSIEEPDLVSPRNEQWGGRGGCFEIPPHSVCVLSRPS